MNPVHSPAPWVRDADATLRGADGKEVGVHQSGLVNVPKSERSVANARLIAAAPDLLDELRAVVSAIGDWARPTGSNGMIPAGESHPLVVAARAGSAAIAKAEGK